MSNLLSVRINQGRQYIADIRNARPPEGFRGLPRISPGTSSGTSPETSSGASPEISSDTSSEISSDTSSEISPEISSDTSSEISSDTSSEISPDTSSEISSDTSSEISPEISSRISPAIPGSPCPEGCARCVESCPTGAVTNAPSSIRPGNGPGIDLGLCIFCPECSRACPGGLIRFTNDVGLGATDAASMIITAARKSPVITPRDEIKRLFSRSLKLRSVSAGGCNGCELELNALSNVNFDMGRFGIGFVASPRHADGVVVTGPATQNMAYALEETVRAVPEPRLLILAGTCAISGGLFKDSPAIDRSFLTRHRPDLYIPGCPVHPLTALKALLKFLGR